MRTGTDKMSHSFNAARCPPTLAATVAVIDKERLKQGVNIIEQQMMDNPIAKGRGDNFPLHRIKNHESHAAADLISAGF